MPATRVAGNRGEGEGGGPGWHNEVSGSAGGPVVQARAIYGDVRIGDSPSRSRPSPPRQLPAAPANFTGRDEELDTLERLACASDVACGLAIVVIVGPGGLGKTSLAARWLHSAGHRYPGGVLSADLGGHQMADAVQPSEVLDGFLRVLGVTPESIPGTMHEQAALFRSVTAGRRTVVFLDNAVSAAQVRVLLPGPGPEPGATAGFGADATRESSDQIPAGEPGWPSLVLVTTRWRIAGLAVDGARFLELGPLEETTAAQLFGRVVGPERALAEQAESREAVRLCGGIPLALCVAGARLAAHPRWPVSRIVRNLSVEHARLSALSLAGDLSVRAAFDVSYRALSAPTAQAYRAVALIPGPDFSAALASAAMDDEEHGQDLLDALVDASLLSETPDGRYRMHDLARLHAREQEGPDLLSGPHGVIARSVAWYLCHAVAADRVVLPGRWRLGPLYADDSAPPAYASAADALEWMESHLPGLLAAVRAAHDSGLHPQAWQLCEALWGTLLFRKHYSAWLDSHQIGLNSARACADRHAQAQMHIQLGAAHRSLGDLGTAARHFSRALELFRDVGHQLGEASALDQLGVVQLRNGRHNEAISDFTKALDIHQTLGRPRGIALMNLNIGQALDASGRQDQAAGYLRTAAGQFESIGEPYHRARALTALGTALIGSGRTGDAEEPLLAALATAEELGASYERAHAHVRLADLAGALGQSARAAQHLEQALVLFTELNAPQADSVRARLEESGDQVAGSAGPDDEGRPPGQRRTR
ncbi:MAG: tetratricopeptide repeat protein [Nocardiopsaceae bacterium]|nr:tetratricopeptide repeat protein [Nocardiopsaceae bacterium]